MYNNYSTVQYRFYVGNRPPFTDNFNFPGDQVDHVYMPTTFTFDLLHVQKAVLNARDHQTKRQQWSLLASQFTIKLCKEVHEEILYYIYT